METWAENVPMQRLGPVRQALKCVLIHPLANYMPAAITRGLLRFTKSELAASNWKDPGGWRSMVISYEDRPHKMIDRILVGSGTISMALRNRRYLGAAALAHLMDEVHHDDPVQALCLGAGPGNIITDAMLKSRRNVRATLVDISNDAFDYGRQLAQRSGLADRVKFIQGDIRDLPAMSAALDGHKPDVVKMLGICEYLTDEQLVGIVQALSAMMPAGSAIVFNDISLKHGTDRFFRRVFGLNMIYRNRADLEALFARGGFGGFTAVAEPLGVYHIVIGRKA